MLFLNSKQKTAGHHFVEEVDNRTAQSVPRQFSAMNVESLSSVEVCDIDVATPPSEMIVPARNIPEVNLSVSYDGSVTIDQNCKFFNFFVQILEN